MSTVKSEIFQHEMNGVETILKDALFRIESAQTRICPEYYHQWEATRKGRDGIKRALNALKNADWDIDPE